MTELNSKKTDKASELRKKPAIQYPSIEELHEISRDLKLKCTTEELISMYEEFKSNHEAYQRVYELNEPQLPVKYPRIPGYKGSIDNSCKVLEGYTPELDATIVTRILDAGGRIMGKSACEDLCFSGSSWTASTAPVKNPYDETRTTGGSSSGSASLIVRGVVDMALGGDQGGSIRIPACWCGIVGLKPTFGLVPYTGIMSIENTIDHIGPMAKSVQDCVALLEAIAGYDDGRDPRQPLGLKIPQYTKMLNDDIKRRKIGTLTEGFVNVDADVEKCAREAIKIMSELGVAIWTVIDFEGTYQCMVKGNGSGYGWKGHYPVSLQEALARRYNLRKPDLSMFVKFCSIWGEYMEKHYQNKFYAKAQNLNMRLTEAYNDALKEYDVLVMPTLPGKPYKLPTKDDNIADLFKVTFGMVRNTAPFNITGHPALTINVGTIGGLPCGMMLVGRKFDEVTELQIAQAFEKILNNFNDNISV